MMKKSQTSLPKFMNEFSNNNRETRNNMQEREVGWVLVKDIPPFFRSADLRAFFSSFIEPNSRFRVFHFKHRQQQVVGDSEEKLLCCLAQLVDAQAAKELLEAYDRQYWYVCGRGRSALRHSTF